MIDLLRNSLRRSAFLLTSVACLSATVAHAAFITGVVVSEVDDELNSGNDGEKTIDGDGLSGSPPVPFTTTHTRSFNEHWTTQDGTVEEAFIEWDLGDVYRLDLIHIWNYNLNDSSGTDVTNRGVQRVDIYYSAVTSGDPGDPEVPGVGNGDNWTLLFGGDSIFPEAPGADSYVGFDLETQVNIDLVVNAARYVRFEIDTNFSDDIFGDHVGLSEVAFFGELVPEPSALVLLVAGLPLLVLLVWRTKTR